MAGIARPRPLPIPTPQPACQVSARSVGAQSDEGHKPVLSPLAPVSKKKLWSIQDRRKSHSLEQSPKPRTLGPRSMPSLMRRQPSRRQTSTHPLRQVGLFLHVQQHSHAEGPKARASPGNGRVSGFMRFTSSWTSSGRDLRRKEDAGRGSSSDTTLEPNHPSSHIIRHPGLLHRALQGVSSDRGQVLPSM